MQETFSSAQRRLYYELLTLHYGTLHRLEREKWKYFTSYISPFYMQPVLAFLYAKNYKDIVWKVLAMMLHIEKKHEELRAFLSTLLKNPKDAVDLFHHYETNFGKPIPNALKKTLRNYLEHESEKKMIQFIKKNPHQKKILADLIRLTHPKFSFDTTLFFEQLHKKVKGRKWKQTLTKAYQKEGSYQEKRIHYAQTWQQLLEKKRLSDSELLQSLDLIFKQSPKSLQKAFLQLKESELSTISPFEVLESYQEVHKAYVKRIHRILHSQEFVESIITEQENELHHLQVASKRIFRKWEDELFFGGYHRLVRVFHELEEHQRIFFSQIHQPNPQDVPQQMAQIVEQGKQIEDILVKFEEHYLSPLPPSFGQEEGWRKIERQALKNLRRKVGFFQELSEVFYSEKAAQLKRLYFYSPDEIQLVLQEVITHLEELEDTILYRIRGRIDAFKDIQTLYLEQARPSMQEALQEMFEVAMGVSKHLNQQLQLAQQKQAIHINNLPEKQQTAFLDEAIEENLAEKDKKKVRKGVKLEDFQSLYKEQVRQSYWQKTNQNEKEELAQLRKQLRNQLEEARKTIQNILEVTKENIEQTLKTARNQLFSIYQQTAQEEKELSPFFEEIRRKVERIFAKKPFEEDFLTLYPDLTKTNDIQEELLQHILPNTLKNLPELQGTTLIVLDEALIHESTALERATWLASLIFHHNNKGASAVQLKILSEHALTNFYTQNLSNVAALQNRLQDAMMSYATSERGNLSVAMRQLNQPFTRLVFLTRWAEKPPHFPFSMLKEYRQRYRISPCVFVLNMQSNQSTRLNLRRNGVFVAQGVYKNSLEWLQEMEE